MPRGAADKGWTITRLAATGKGQRHYRQCGCLHWREYGAMIRALFDAGQDLPPWLRNRADFVKRYCVGVGGAGENFE